MNITIRRADDKDCEIFNQMFACLNDLHVAEHPSIFQSVSGPIFPQDAYAELLEDATACLLIAECDGQPGGFVLLRLRDTQGIPVMTMRNYAVVDSLYVHPHLRQRGLGEMLMLSGEEWAVENGATSLTLNVYDFNTAARGLYEKLGYQSLSRKLIKQL